MDAMLRDKFRLVRPSSLHIDRHPNLKDPLIFGSPKPTSTK